MPRTSSISLERNRGEAIIVTDVGQHQMWEAQYYTQSAAHAVTSADSVPWFCTSGRIAQSRQADSEVW